MLIEIETGDLSLKTKALLFDLCAEGAIRLKDRDLAPIMAVRQPISYEETEDEPETKSDAETVGKGNHFSKALSLQVKDMALQGKTRQQIARATGLKERQISYHLSELRQQGQNIPVLSRAKGWHKKAVNAVGVLNRKNQHWKPSEDKTLRDMMANNMSKKTIKRALGRTSASIRNRIPILGLR